MIPDGILPVIDFKAHVDILMNNKQNRIDNYISLMQLESDLLSDPRNMGHDSSDSSECATEKEDRHKPAKAGKMMIQIEIQRNKKKVTTMTM